MKSIEVLLADTVCMVVAGVLFTEYSVIELPLLMGALHVIVAVVLSAEILAVPIVGVLGTV